MARYIHRTPTGRKQQAVSTEHQLCAEAFYLSISSLTRLILRTGRQTRQAGAEGPRRAMDREVFQVETSDVDIVIPMFGDKDHAGVDRARIVKGFKCQLTNGRHEPAD